MKRSWKTSLLGIVGGLAMIFGQAAQDRSNGGVPITFGNLAGPITVMALGLLAKDHDVTGGQ